MKRGRVVIQLLAAALLLWLVAGAGLPWCLDDGLRLLAASGPRLERVAELDAVVNTGALQPSSPLKAPLFPVLEPFVQWKGQGPLLVFPPLYLALLWLFRRLGEFGPTILAALSALGLAWAARGLLGEADHGSAPQPAVPLWLWGLLASPSLFYLGTSWELTLTSLLLLLLLRERTRPWPLWVSLGYGLLPWLRPEALLLWAGGLVLLRGWPRRALSVGGFLAGLWLQQSLTGSRVWLQVKTNFAGADWNPLANLGSFWLPAPAGLWIWLGAGLLLALLAAQRFRRLELPALAVWGLALAIFLYQQATQETQLLPSWGLLVAAPAALWALLRFLRPELRRGLEPELALLASFLLVVTLLSPVNVGFHWGPRLLVPALLPLGLWWLQREPEVGSRRVVLGLGVGLQLLSLVLLAGRHQLVREQDRQLEGLRAPVLVTTESYLLGDHPWLARERTLLRPFGEKAARTMLQELHVRQVRELDLVVRPGHPLPILLVRHLGLLPRAAPLDLPGSRLGSPLVLHQLSLPD